MFYFVQDYGRVKPLTARITYIEAKKKKQKEERRKRKTVEKANLIKILHIFSDLHRKAD